ncbi:alpha/beta-hydrolase [Mycena epipterygia]|nr:alpha/beta-hydrolase [Mycena epipterygia]
MPLIHLETSTGPGSFHYTISTPTNASTTAIVQGTPTVLLIHPVYVPSHIFHPIYSDSSLRRFNLVTLDLRGHGGTTATVEDTYGPETAARDILRLMVRCPKYPSMPCHAMGVSMGACIALQMAILAPERVISLFMLSPLPLTEPALVVEGRQEIYDCWIHAFEDPNGVDELALGDAFTGSLQLAYNNRDLPLITAVASRSLSLAIRNWGSGNHDIMHIVSVKFFLNRELYSVSTLSRVRCLIVLVHCSEDVAYPINYSEELLDLLHSAALDAKIHSIDGAPHFGNITHSKEYVACRAFREILSYVDSRINALLYDFVLANHSGTEIPAAPTSVESPFLAQLLECGLLDGDSDSESDSDSSE